MKKLTLLIFAFCVWLVPAFASAEPAMISGVVVTKPPIKLSFNVKNAFNRDIEEAVRSGMPTSFVFQVELNKVNRVLPDELVGQWEFRHTVKYDSFRDEYEVSLDETGEEVRTKDFNEMKSLMTSCSGVTVAPAHLMPGQPYELRIKAQMDPVDLPFLLNYVFFFLKFWDFDTDWHVHAFTP